MSTLYQALNPLPRRNLGAAVQVERNRLAVLLSQLRPGLTSADFRELLEMQFRCDDLMCLHALPRRTLQSWISRVRLELDSLYTGIESEQFQRRQLNGLILLYRELTEGNEADAFRYRDAATAKRG